MQHPPRFDPLRLQPDASLNRTHLTALPGTEPEWAGRPAFDLLSRAALLQLVKTNGEAGAADIFGRRLGHLIATLRGGGDDHAIRTPWRQAYRRYWTSVEQVWLGGGLVARLGAGLLDAARSEIVRLGVGPLRIELAPFPAALPLIGAGRINSGLHACALVFDFGHTWVKRGLATYSARQLTGLELFEPVEAPPAASVFESTVQVTADALRCASPRLDPLVVISLASYVDRSGLPADSHSLYAPLGRVPLAALADSVRHRSGGRSVRVRLAHDGTLAACGVVPAASPAAVIMLGTALGVGFAPAADRLCPLAPNFTITKGSADP